MSGFLPELSAMASLILCPISRASAAEVLVLEKTARKKQPELSPTWTGEAEINPCPLLFYSDMVAYK
jgi:hypothetical protein